MPVAEPLLEPMPVEPPAPVAGDVVEPVDPPTEPPADEPLPAVPLVLLPAAPVLLLEPTPAEPAPSSRRQRSFSVPAAIRSQRALPRAAVVSEVVDDVLPLALGDVVLPPTLGAGAALGEVVLVLPLAPLFDCAVVLPVAPEAPVEPVMLPEPEVCAKAVSENARIAAVPIAFNI